MLNNGRGSKPNGICPNRDGKDEDGWTCGTEQQEFIRIFYFFFFSSSCFTTRCSPLGYDRPRTNLLSLRRWDCATRDSSLGHHLQVQYLCLRSSSHWAR